MERGRRRGRGFERAVGAVVFGLPLLYLWTERSREVWLWRWSAGWCIAVGAGTLAYALFLASYSRPWSESASRARSRLVAAAASILAAVLACEVALRARRAPPPASYDNRGRHAFDPDVGHVYLPGFEQELRSSEFSVRWRSNAQGLRAERDYGPKPAGTRRVLALGDSFTAGDQVELAQTWPAVLEACLNGAAGEPVEVLNAGFPGFGTVHELNWLRKFGAAFQPDLVLVALTPNDLLENQFPILYVAREGALVDHRSTEFDRERWRDRQRWYSLPGLVARSALAARLRAAARRLRSDHASPHWRAFQVEPDAKSRQLQSRAEELLLAMRELSLSMGARFAVLVIPFREQLGPPEPGSDPRLLGRRLEAWGSAAQVPVLDLFEAFRSSPLGPGLYWREDAHCTAAGYRLIGEQACRFLELHGLTRQ